MAHVLEELEQVREIDAKAQKQLLADLKKTRLEDWPLVVEQFYSGLRYREQLRTRSSTDPISKEVPSNGKSSNDALAQSRERADHLPQHGINPGAPLGAHGTQGSLPTTVLEPTTVAIANAPVSPPLLDTTETGFTKTPGSAAILASHTTPVATSAIKRLPGPSAIPKTDTKPRKPHKGVPWQQQLSTALQSLTRQVSEPPETNQDVPAVAQLELLPLAAGQPDTDLQSVPDISSTNSDMSSTDLETWTQQLFALATNTGPGSTMDSQYRAATASHQLEKFLVHLREEAALSVCNLAFCTTVYDYGAYDEYIESRFPTGKQLSLYAEVENFQSCMTNQGYFTSLASSYELLDKKGNPVDRGDFPSVEDYCRNRRRDFHIEYGLSLPEHITPDKYRLQLTIKDNLSGKTGQNIIEFEVTGHLAE